eukprot:3391892-Pyramimonas_sp.AAC.1
MLGDFSISEHPARGLTRSADARALENYHGQPTFWKHLLRHMADATTTSTTHRCPATLPNRALTKCSPHSIRATFPWLRLDCSQR